MESISFSYQKTALIDAQQIDQLTKKIEPICNALRAAHAQKNYETSYASINLPFDDQLFSTVNLLTEKKKQLKPSLMIVVGIGGSNLGTQAVYEALYGAQGNPAFPLYFADTADSDTIAALLTRVENELRAARTVLICVISKSGSTTETIANFECFLALLKKYYPKNYHEFVIAITDHNSPLWQLAGQQQFDCLAIPAPVGGRYSVLSAVGLFPLAFTGIDIKALRKGAQAMVAQCLEGDIQKNPAAISAAVIAYHYQKGIAIHDLFLFSVALESLGKWYRQLMGESIGKVNSAQQKVGITPTVSMGSTDLHSVGQLYLAGPAVRLTTFVTLEQNQHEVIVPEMPEYEKLVNSIQGKPLKVLMRAIVHGVQKVYAQEKRAFMTIALAKKDAYSMGQFLQFKMIEIMYLGALLDVNPFDQPQVELYKIQTRKILAHE